MRVEPVPEVGLRHRVPGPVGGLKVLEDDAGLVVPVRCIAPDIEVPVDAPRFCTAGPLEPGVLVRGVVDDEFDDDVQSPFASGAQKGAEIAHRAEAGVDSPVVRDVVPVIAQG